MNVAVILRAVQLVRAQGVMVTFEPGWETRGNGYALKPVGVLVHHTGTPSSVTNPFPTRKVLRDGRSNLSGPLCNSAGPADGSVHIVAAQAANHAGASGGKSMGPLPVTTLFNPTVWGHEIDYAGTVPMLAVQYRSAALWCNALLQAMTEAGLIPRMDFERVRAHAETSITGKWDAGYALDRTIDMRQFRADVARPQEIDVALDPTERAWLEDILRRVQSIHAYGWLPLPANLGSIPHWSAGGNLTEFAEFLQREMNGNDVQEAQSVTLAEIRAMLRDHVNGSASRPALDVSHEQLVAALADPAVASAMATALADEQDRRARDGDGATGPTT